MKEEIIMDYNVVVENLEKAHSMPYIAEGKRYLPDHIFDENESVIWNKNEVVKRNKQRDELTKKIREDRSFAIANAEADVLTYIKERGGFSDKVCNNIYSYAWDMGHSSGVREVMQYVDDLIDVFVG
jgi:hypothetical protein